MHVLVTGGAGFIGSHLVEALLARGDQVTVIDDFSSGSKSNLPLSDRLRVIEFQLSQSLPADLPANTFAAVVHLAGLPSVAASWEKARDAHDRNLTATVALLDACDALDIPRFIFASSAAVYGVPVELPIPENAPCRPLSPYGLQKLAGEKYLELFANERGLCGVSLRLFNVYGPRQRPDSAYSGVISIFAGAIRNRQPLIMFGDGSQTRDFVFVGDVVEAICAAIDVSMVRGEALTFNIGTGNRSSLLELVDTLVVACRSEPPQIIHRENRAGDIQHSQPDVRAAANVLGFRTRSTLVQGLGALIGSL